MLRRALPKALRSFSFFGVAFTIGVMLVFPGCNSTGSTEPELGVMPNQAPSKVAHEFRHDGPTGTTISVDLRPYWAALIAQMNNGNLTGHMLCQASPSQDKCETTLSDTAGEVRQFYGPHSNVIVNYIAIGSHDYKSIDGSSTKRIGTIRNHEGGTSGDSLRCFTVMASSTNYCASPAAEALGPPYLIPSLPVVSYTVLEEATNDDGSPTEPVPGSLLVTPDASTGNYWNFGIQNMTASGCVQSYAGGSKNREHIVYVKNVPFGGTIGTQDAIVHDGDSGDSSESDLLERTIYVEGLGAVEDGIAHYDPRDGLYDNTPHYNAAYNNEDPIDSKIINIYPAQCPQGSAVPLWGSSSGSKSRK